MAMRTNGRRLARDGDPLTLSAMPGGDAMAPPELARDAPVADVFHPLEEDHFAVVGDEADAAALHCFNGFLGERLRAHKPLRREQGLDDGLAAVALADVHDVRFDLDEFSR